MKKAFLLLTLFGQRISLGFKSLLNYARVLKKNDNSTQRVLTIIKKPLSPQGILAIIGAAFDDRITGSISWDNMLPNWEATFNWKKIYRWGQRINDLTCSASIRDPQSPLSLIRDGAINLEHLVELIGIVRDFYAGLGPKKMG